MLCSCLSSFLFLFFVFFSRYFCLVCLLPFFFFVFTFRFYLLFLNFMFFINFFFSPFLFSFSFVFLYFIFCIFFLFSFFSFFLFFSFYSFLFYDFDARQCIKQYRPLGGRRGGTPASRVGILEVPNFGNPKFRNSEIVLIPIRYSAGHQLILWDNFG